jgi:hypothetical protein
MRKISKAQDQQSLEVNFRTVTSDKKCIAPGCYSDPVEPGASHCQKHLDEMQGEGYNSGRPYIGSKEDEEPDNDEWIRYFLHREDSKEKVGEGFDSATNPDNYEWTPITETGFNEEDLKRLKSHYKGPCGCGNPAYAVDHLGHPVCWKHNHGPQPGTCSRNGMDYESLYTPTNDPTHLSLKSEYLMSHKEHEWVHPSVVGEEHMAIVHPDGSWEHTLLQRGGYPMGVTTGKSPTMEQGKKDLLLSLMRENTEDRLPKEEDSLSDEEFEKAKKEHGYRKTYTGSFNSKFAKENEEHDHYKYIKKKGDKWVVIQKGTGKVLSHHDTREKAIASFKAMMVSKHGGVKESLDLSGLHDLAHMAPHALHAIEDVGRGIGDAAKAVGRGVVDVAKGVGDAVTTPIRDLVHLNEQAAYNKSPHGFYENVVKGVEQSGYPQETQTHILNNLTQNIADSHEFGDYVHNLGPVLDTAINGAQDQWHSSDASAFVGDVGALSAGAGLATGVGFTIKNLKDRLNSPARRRKRRHSSVEHSCDIGSHKGHFDVTCVTEGCPSKGKSWDGDGHQNWDCDYACPEHR